MTCISRQNVGKYTYLYESVSFRDQNGRPRNKKVSIGKIDPVTGMPVFKKEYLERMAAAGTPIEQEAPSIPRESLGIARNILASNLPDQLSWQSERCHNTSDYPGRSHFPGSWMCYPHCHG